MNGRFLPCFAALAVVVATPALAADDEASSLRLVPFPKQVALAPGAFLLKGPLVVRTGTAAGTVVGTLVVDELRRAGVEASFARSEAADALLLDVRDGAGAPDLIELGDDHGEEAYALRVDPLAVTVRARHAAGLRHGVATLVQLIRANRRREGLPCLTVHDWPLLRWRCFQDDLTRGPSTRLEALKNEIDVGASLKLNLFTYYMEYQFAFKKHPLIGPRDGSLEPGELARLVAHARPQGVDVLGNQQSFGHFGRILALDKYAPLRETADVLTPMKDETYRFLDDLYSEVCPVLPFPMFNVCCDETDGLGTGPSRELAAQIGVGGVYVRHIRRIHNLLRDKYHKRMMMWGDIIIQHPDRLGEVPKDVVMLAWEYSARPGFEPQILPFARSGYEFFVCPGVSNWSRILPDFAVAEVNIRNFVRDGVKHHALGMINTSWEDDGEALKGVIWHAHAWAAECAWNASATDPAAFNRRVGAVVFGERGDYFGQAVALLSKTHTLPGMGGMFNKRFWDHDLTSPPPAASRAEAGALLALVRPAIEHLEACRRESAINAEQLDAFDFGARRMELIGQRTLDRLDALGAYEQAQRSQPSQALAALDRVATLLRRDRDAHEALGKQFARLWLRDCKPYALDGTTARYRKGVDDYDGLLRKVGEARTLAAAGKPLPAIGGLGAVKGPR
jgi:hexosaminidase